MLCTLLIAIHKTRILISILILCYIGEHQPSLKHKIFKRKTLLLYSMWKCAVWCLWNVAASTKCKLLNVTTATEQLFIFLWLKIARFRITWLFQRCRSSLSQVPPPVERLSSTSRCALFQRSTMDSCNWYSLSSMWRVLRITSHKEVTFCSNLVSIFNNNY